MKKGIIFIAPLGARNKKAVLFNEIVSLYPENDYSSVLYLTPNVFVLTEAERQFFFHIKRFNKKPTYIPFQTFTIRHLAEYLHQLYCREDIISDRLRPLILCEILKEKNIGHSRLLSDLFKKIKHYVLHKSLAQLKEEVKQQIFEEKAAQRAVNAIETLERYEVELNKRGLIDSEEMLKNSVSLIRKHLSPVTLVIDGFFDPTLLELEIIKALVEKAERTFILLEEDTELFNYFQSHPEGMMEKRLRSAIHRDDAGYHPYPSLEEEVEGIARMIKNLILQGIRPWEIIVSFPVLSKYLPMLKRVFQKHDIPLSIEEYELSTTKPLVALEEMITCIEDDYPKNDFLSFLTSPHFPAIPDILKEWAITYSYRAGIVKGKDSWLSIKEILFNSLAEELSEADKGRIGKFQRELRQVINLLEDIKNKKDLGSFIDAFEATLDKLGFFDSLSDGDEILNKITNRFSELRRFASLYGLSPSDVTTSGLYLRHLLKDIKGMDEKKEGVRVVPYELAAGLEAKALFFGGMIEGEFPYRPEIDPILPERVKKSLRMPHLEYYLHRQRQYFKRLLHISIHEPCFSCPTADGDKVFLPSPFLDWGKTITPPALNIPTKEEILIREGAIKSTEEAPRMFWDEKIFHDKEVRHILSQRIGTIPKDYIRVTDIDFYRRCPLRFYIEKVLCIEIEKPPRFEVEGRLWGSLAHKTMEYVFRDRSIKLEDIEKRLFQGLEISLKQFPIGDFWSRVAREIFRRLLPVLKEQETDIRMEGFIPYKVEENIIAEVNGLKLKGKIDRVDKKLKTKNSKLKIEDSQPKPSESVILLDYKTSSVDDDSLQLPLYASMWQKRYSEPVEKVGFYSLKDGRVRWYPKGLDMEEFIQWALETAERLVKEMRKGMFSPAPYKDEECRFCYHSPLCKTAK
jgi:ATP-dependent helicase/DNAse subunit B